MGKKLEFRKYVSNTVYAVTNIKNGYGFRVVLKFADGSTITRQHAGFKTKKEANKERDEVLGQLYSETYIVYGKIRVAEFMTHWLEEVMRPKITDNTYGNYKNIIYNYVNPQLGTMYMSTLNQGHIKKLYDSIAEKSEAVARNAKVVMNTSFEYAKNKNVIMANCAEKVMLPKHIKKKAYRTQKIDVTKTLTLEQVVRLIDASKGTPVYMQILFASLMGLRRGEINGLKYSDVDYINRTLKVQRQLGKLPNSYIDDVPLKMLTKQEIPVKTESSNREIPIPDYVFEAILEQRKIYEKNRRRRKKEFRDWDYICCSTYGNPRSKSFHYKYFKELLKKCGLPDIHFHQLRNTYTTILLKNDFNIKGVSNMLGHSKEIISADVYGDTKEIIEDCVYALDPFIENVMPEYIDNQYYDYTDFDELDAILEEHLAVV